MVVTRWRSGILSTWEGEGGEGAWPCRGAARPIALGAAGGCLPCGHDAGVLLPSVWMCLFLCSNGELGIVRGPRSHCPCVGRGAWLGVGEPTQCTADQNQPPAGQTGGLPGTVLPAFGSSVPTARQNRVTENHWGEFGQQYQHRLAGGQGPHRSQQKGQMLLARCPERA